jgi:hypothetical protein
VLVRKRSGNAPARDELKKDPPSVPDGEPPVFAIIRGPPQADAPSMGCHEPSVTVIWRTTPN